MTRTELKNAVAHKELLKTIKLNAKAIYLLSDVREAYSYLDSRIGEYGITSNEIDEIFEEISEECADITMFQITELKEKIKSI